MARTSEEVGLLEGKELLQLRYLLIPQYNRLRFQFNTHRLCKAVVRVAYALYSMFYQLRRPNWQLSGTKLITIKLKQALALEISF